MGHFSGSLLVTGSVCLSLLVPAPAAAGDMTMSSAKSSEDLAFARYIASLEQPDPFGTEMVAVTIEAWSPFLHQESRVVMLRRPDPAGRTLYLPLRSEGDLGATLDLISPYLEERDRLERLPTPSRAITPANYKFRYVGAVETEGAPAYIFRIVPKEKHDGLIQGQLWIDSQTGVPVANAGYLVKTPAGFIRRIEVTQDTRFTGTSPASRISHIVMETKRAGRGLLTITERLVTEDNVAPSEPSVFHPSGPLTLSLFR